MKTIKYILYLVTILFLTIVTQIGGVALIIGLIVSRYVKFDSNRFVFSVGVYLILTFLITPFVAPLFGRERIKNTDSIKPTSFLTILFNRNYVIPELNELLSSTLDQLPAKLEIRYLDANFPFLNKFPLLPHLSHNDGKKIDVSLMYEREPGDLTNLKPSRTGYGVFVDSHPEEFNQTDFCKQKGYWHYDFPKYLSLGEINSEIKFSSKFTRSLINGLLNNPGLEKLFVEKHLLARMGLSNSRIRFQGCRAVRHDDHIHIQVK